MITCNDDEDDEIDESLMITAIFPEHLWGAPSVRDSAEASLPWGSYLPSFQNTQEVTSKSVGETD